MYTIVLEKRKNFFVFALKFFESLIINLLNFLIEENACFVLLIQETLFIYLANIHVVARIVRII
jgi:hypothetical protein